MTRFLIRRLLLSIPVLIGIVFVVFALARIIPGDPCVAALGERANPKTCAEYSRAHGLDKAIVPGFFRVDLVLARELPDADLVPAWVQSEPPRSMRRPMSHRRG